MFLVLSCFQHVFQLRSVFFYSCSHVYLSQSTCFYAIFYAQIYVFTRLYVQIYMLRVLYHVSFCFVLLLRLYAHMLDIMSMVMLCSDLCVRMLFSMFYAQIHIRTHLYAWFHVPPCFCASFHMFTHALPCLCLDLHFYMLACSDLGFHMLICLDLYFIMLVCLGLCSACFMPSFVCFYTRCHVCVPRLRLCLSCHMLLQPFCHFIFLSCVLAYWFGPDLDPMVFVIVHIPWPISKGLYRLFFMSMLACFYTLCLCQPLQFQALPRLTPLVSCGGMVTSNVHKALFGCSHLGCIAVMLIALCTHSPFSTPCDDMFTMLVCATRWLVMHLYTLAYMSMHESCLLVCHPCFNTMKLWTSDPNLHLSIADTTLLFTFCLFVCYLACLPARMFARILVASLAISILLVCPLVCLLVSQLLRLPYLSCLFALRPLDIIYAFSFPCLSASFLVFSFVCTHMERGYTELGHDLLGASKKGMDSSMRLGRVAAISRFKVQFSPFGYVLFQTPSFLLSFSLR